jgi:hypothetical protein
VLQLRVEQRVSIAAQIRVQRSAVGSKDELKTELAKSSIVELKFDQSPNARQLKTPHVINYRDPRATAVRKTA